MLRLPGPLRKIKSAFVVLTNHMPGTSFARETEWSLICAASSGLNTRDDFLSLLQKPIRWKLLFDLAERHGVLPLLSQALFSVADQIPAGETLNLKERYQANLHKALFLSREFIRIVDRLSGEGIEVLPYKGLALAETIYGDIALRQSGDIDLLVRSSDFRRIEKVVGELGFTPHLKLRKAEQQAYLKSGYECAFDGAAGRNLLEVQWSVQPRFYAVDFDMDGVFQRAVSISVAGRSMKAPSMEDLYIILALHAAKHVWQRLIWICDLGRIGACQTLNWNWIGEQARQLGIVRIIRVTLLLVQRMLGVPVSPAQAGLGDDEQSEKLAAEIEYQTASEMEYDVESLAYFRLMLRLRERRTDQIRFMSRLLLTPGPGEWAVIRLPKGLFPFYRVVRLTRVAARVVHS